MDRRLPARLNELSNRPEGSLPFPTKPGRSPKGRRDARHGGGHRTAFNPTPDVRPDGVHSSQRTNCECQPGKPVAARFWFHHILGLRYETTVGQMRSVMHRITGLLENYPLVHHFPMPVRFFRLGAYSLDLEIFAHLAVRDLGHFLELQGRLLLQIMEVIEAESARLAIPARTAYLAVTPGSDLSSAPALFDKPGPNRSQQNRDAARDQLRIERPAQH